MADFAVEVAYGGAEALSLARTFLPAVVLDLAMPVLDGFGAAQGLRRSASLPFLVALSSDARPETMARVAQAGFCAHFLRPTEVGRLVTLLSGGSAAEPR